MHPDPAQRPPQDPYQPDPALRPPQDPYRPDPVYYAPPPAPPPPQPSPSWWTTQGVLLLVVAAVAMFSILAVVGVATWVIVRTHPDPVASPAVSAAPPPVADPINGLAFGSGAVRVDVYVDYQCPPCSLFEESTGEALSTYVSAKRITLAVHPVAFIDERSKNRYSTRAAAAMACAYEAGKGAEYHRYLLEHQPPEDTAGPADTDLIAAGNGLGTASGFENCVTGHQKLSWVDQATASANRYGVESVPAVYVNGKEIQTTRSALTSAIDNVK